MAALISLLISVYIITPQYTASTTLMVTRPLDKTQILFQDIQVTRQLVATYREIVHSRRVLELTIAAMTLPFDTSELREKIAVDSVRDTEIILIGVTDPDPQLARDIANELARAFIDQIEEIMLVDNVSVVDAAVTPKGPVSPRVPLNTAVALVVGLMAAIGFAFLIEYLDQSIKDPLEAERLLDLPVIGVIPLSEEKGQLYTFNNPRSPASEAFRTLRTNIQYTGVDRPMKKILIGGANPACGKSTLSANLAITLAQTGSKVLLIDADLRKPTQHKLFNLNSEPGLSSLVFKDLKPDQVIQKTENENLFLLTSGPLPTYPAELLGSEKMKELVDFLATHFDYLIFDSPPIIAVTDAALISRLTDGTILVLDHGRVKKDEAVGALEQLKKVQAYMIGAVLNVMPTGEGYYYYNSYYGDYYGSEEKKT